MSNRTLPRGKSGLAAAASLGALLAGAATAQVVDTGRAQCCSSIAPNTPPATYYGATMYRNDDPRSAWAPYEAAAIDPPAPIEQLLEEIEVLELEGGPMNPALAPRLGWLGAAYLQKNRTTEGIRYLRRGIHLARVNGGLYTPQQVGMLEQLIAAHISRKNFAEADEQQHYLYRIQSWQQEHADNPELLEATMRYADWMRTAYLGDIDQMRFPRLVRLHDLYENAIEEITESRGENSPELLPFLQGQIELCYLISVYPGERDSSFRNPDQAVTDFQLPDEAQLRFWRMRDHNFRYGQQALERREEVLKHNPDSSPRERAQARIATADWYQWNHRYARAIRMYEEAWAIMADQDDAESWLRKEFGTPMELPRETVFNPGVIPLGTRNQAEVAVDFSVSRRGEAKDITILTEAVDEDTQSAITRAYHYLRNVRFRPRLENGKVVASNTMQRNYQIRY